MLSDSVALQELWVRLCLPGLGVILASLFPMGLADLLVYLYP